MKLFILSPVLRKWVANCFDCTLDIDPAGQNGSEP